MTNNKAMWQEINAVDKITDSTSELLPALEALNSLYGMLNSVENPYSDDKIDAAYETVLKALTTREAPYFDPAEHKRISDAFEDGQRNDVPEGYVIFAPIFEELKRAVTKFPTWPTDPIHALKVLDEESGELSKEVFQMVYEPHKTSKEEIRAEATQTAAMALRFWLSLDRYEYKPGEQHNQGTLSAAIAEESER